MRPVVPDSVRPFSCDRGKQASRTRIVGKREVASEEALIMSGGSSKRMYLFIC